MQPTGSVGQHHIMKHAGSAGQQHSMQPARSVTQKHTMKHAGSAGQQYSMQLAGIAGTSQHTLQPVESARRQHTIQHVGGAGQQHTIEHVGVPGQQHSIEHVGVAGQQHTVQHAGGACSSTPCSMLGVRAAAQHAAWWKFVRLLRVLIFTFARLRDSFIRKLISTSQPLSNPTLAAAAFCMRSRPGFQCRQGGIIKSFWDNVHVLPTRFAFSASPHRFSDARTAFAQNLKCVPAKQA
eukprot:364071-Chlamydomonas_euryale.AAC.4